MNKENTEKLLKDFPDFFKHKDDLLVSLMMFGFECSDGWYDLIYNLCDKIKEYFINDSEYLSIPDHFYVIQVKEKFGGLRFYISSAPEYVHTIVNDAELKSYYICEECGKECVYDKKNRNYKSFYRDNLSWVRTLCNDCLKEYLNKRRLKQLNYISDWQKKNKAPYRKG